MFGKIKSNKHLTQKSFIHVTIHGEHTPLENHKFSHKTGKF